MMDGLLSFVKTPAGQGLLSAAFGGLANAQRGAPVNTIGRAGLAGLLGYNAAQNQDLQRQEAAQMGKYRDMQLQSAQAALEKDKLAQSQALAQQAWLNQFAMPKAPVLGMTDAANTQRGAGTTPQFGEAEYRQAIAMGIKPETIDAFRRGGREEIKDYQQVRNPDGTVSIVGFDKFGGMKNTNATPFIKPEVRDFGGGIGGIDPITNSVQMYGKKTMSPSDMVTMRGQNMVDARAKERLALDSSTGQTYSTKPLPASALKMQNDSLDALGAAAGINATLAQKEKLLNDGKLKFGPVSNITNSALNYAGMSTQESRNFASFKSDLEKMRNESLRLNSGVQTEGDAQRAWNELFQNINDDELVKQRLQEIRGINARAADLHKLKIDSVRSNYNVEPFDFSKVPGAASNGGTAASPQPQATMRFNPQTGKLEQVR